MGLGYFKPLMKVAPDVPYYVAHKEERVILYSDMRINNSKYSAADICFVCDITGSMNIYIDTVRDVLVDFLNVVQKEINTVPRVAFIGYRDKLAKPEDEECAKLMPPQMPQIMKKNFTMDYGDMVEFIRGIDCDGGYDTCEDIVTPLREALMLDSVSYTHLTLPTICSV
eukprot:TRINITY_DN10724_c0_g1_i2.p1 TRINITY_DN10724_c0_g1~~TRINITY_DN10724_c0_g1_i2.p1  ORF type:complete len:169 (+),score=23.12 TRINITY_DN10724_c0_g1_i2:98-604(+)